jgi:hypothetical protein
MPAAKKKITKSVAKKKTHPLFQVVPQEQSLVIVFFVLVLILLFALLKVYLNQ